MYSMICGFKYSKHVIKQIVYIYIPLTTTITAMHTYGVIKQFCFSIFVPTCPIYKLYNNKVVNEKAIYTFESIDLSCP